MPSIGVDGGEQRVPWVVPVRFLESQRMFEIEADQLAIPALASAGYDARALVEYVRREQKDPRVLSYSWLPRKDSRITLMEKAISAQPEREYIRPSDEFLRMQQTVRPYTVPHLVRH